MTKVLYLGELEGDCDPSTDVEDPNEIPGSGDEGAYDPLPDTDEDVDDLHLDCPQCNGTDDLDDLVAASEDNSQLEGLDEPRFDLSDANAPTVTIAPDADGTILVYGTTIPPGYVQTSERDLTGGFCARPRRADEVEDLPEDDLETAALICAIGASNPDLSECYECVLEAIGGELFSPASDLAHDAWSDARTDNTTAEVLDLDPLIDAEADAALRVLLDREHAAMMCDMIAADRAGGIRNTSISTDAGSAIGASWAARQLACVAFFNAPCRDEDQIELEYADAAAMLRSGRDPP